MAEARQVVKYTFLKVEAPVLSWPATEREAAAREFTELLEAGPTGETLLAYSTVGLRGDCDLLIWQAATRSTPSSAPSRNGVPPGWGPICEWHIPSWR